MFWIILVGSALVVAALVAALLRWRWRRQERESAWRERAVAEKAVERSQQTAWREREEPDDSTGLATQMALANLQGSPPVVGSLFGEPSEPESRPEREPSPDLSISMPASDPSPILESPEVSAPSFDSSPSYDSSPSSGFDSPSSDNSSVC